MGLLEWLLIVALIGVVVYPMPAPFPTLIIAIWLLWIFGVDVPPSKGQ